MQDFEEAERTEKEQKFSPKSRRGGSSVLV